MPIPLLAGIGAGLGALGGLLKSGPDVDMFGRQEAGKAYDAFKNLTAKGPGEQDVSAALGASRDYANTLNNTASSGLYDMGAGNRLAEQQFAGQRQSLAQSLQDQMAKANRAASSAGRSSNDPILRARLGAEAMRQTASMNAMQSSAAMDLGRQSTLDMLNLSGQRVNTLQGLANQAFSNQQSLFGMGQNLQNMDLSAAQYEQGRGGGLKGALTGAITGAGAGLQFATGLGDIANNAAMTTAQTGMMNSFAKAAPGLAQMGANLTAPQMQQQAQQPIPFNQAYFNPANFAGVQMLGPVNRPPQMANVFGPNSMSWK